MKPVGLVIGILAIMMMLLGILTVVSSKKTYYLPEGFASGAIASGAVTSGAITSGEEDEGRELTTEEAEAALSEAAAASESTITAYPTDQLENIKNPLIKIVKKLGNMSVFFANPKVWYEVYRTSKMSLADLARENIKKEREKAAAAT
jgi:hypothetical protein